MAKKTKSSATTSAAVPQKGSPVTSAVSAKADIDDIFAKPSAPTPQTSAAGVDTQNDSKTSEVSKSKKKKKTKAAATADNASIERETSPPSTTTTKSKRRKSTDATHTEPSHPSKTDTSAPEVAVFSDPSATSNKKQKTVTEGSGKAVKSREQMVKDDEDERAFRDSRGDGPRRKTEEGFFIFKEAELGIRPESGGKFRFCGYPMTLH